MERLINAVRSNNVAAVEKYIKRGTDINCVYEGSLPLCEACRAGNLAIVDMLIKSGAKIDQIDGDRNMPLNLAVQFSRVQIVRRILQENPSQNVINNTNQRNETPIESAMAKGKLGNPEIIKLLLESTQATGKSEGATAKAIPDQTKSGSHKMQKESPDEKTVALFRVLKTNDWMELHSLYFKDYFQEYDFETRGPDDLTALTAAITSRSHNFMYIDDDNTRCIEALLEAGCDVNAKDTIYEEITPLLAAAEQPHTNEIMKELLLAGADIRVKDSRGLNVLDHAFEYRDSDRISKYDSNYQYGFYKMTPEFEESCRILKDLLNAAGVSDLSKRYHRAELSLSIICRRQIRSYLLNPTGANNKNLLVAVSKLPIPEKLKNFLLHYVDLTKIKDIQPPLDYSDYGDSLYPDDYPGMFGADVW